MSLTQFIQEMPKVELHVHLEGAIQAETLLALAKRNQVKLPANTVSELQQWYQFRDFSHFLEIYLTLSRCIRTPEDIYFITQAFLKQQADQNIMYSEVTYTPYTHYRNYKIPFEKQLEAINQARQWAEKNLSISMGLVVDISREVSVEEGQITAEWAISGKNNGVVALGLGGPEIGNPPEKFQTVFDYAHQNGLPTVPHAGETAGADSVLGAIEVLHAKRIGHGVRCLENPDVVKILHDRQIPLEVCPTSNLCLNVCNDIYKHPLPQLLASGLYVTINSDDPALFNTTLTKEYLALAKCFDFKIADLQQFVLNAVNASFLNDKKKASLQQDIISKFNALTSLLET